VSAPAPSIRIGAPGSIAEMLSTSRRRYGSRWCVFRYGSRDIILRASCATEDAARSYAEPGDVLVDVHGYGCATLDSVCSCGKPGWTDTGLCGVCEYCE